MTHRSLAAPVAVAAFTALLSAQEWRVLSPMGASGPSLAYDSVRQRTVLFGGRSRSGPLADTWEYDGTLWRQATTHRFPPPRSGHELTFDARRARVVLFGGQLGLRDLLDETWEYDGRNWTRVVTATWPQARVDHALVYDRQRSRAVLFGGWVPASSVLFDDTWEYDGCSWVRRSSATSPTARARHALAYDPVRGRTVLFGGIHNAATLADTWEWDGTVWTQTVGGPPARCAHAMTFDLARNRTLLYGGERNGQQITDTWEFDGASWTPASGSAPATDSMPAMAYDQARATAVLFSSSSYSGATWERPSASAAWTLAADRAPSPRGHHAIAYDWSRARTVLFGGTGFAAPVDGDTWEWDGSRWHEMPAVPSPPARWYHAMAHDVARSRTVLFGGWDRNNVELADTWEWDGTTWTQRFPAQSPPPRMLHAMSYDWSAQRTVLFGGAAPAPMFQHADTWLWDGNNWQQAFPAMVPTARQAHSLAYDVLRNRTVLFGGTSLSGAATGTFEWDGSNWTQIAGVSPPDRYGAALAYDLARARTVLFGGFGGLNVGNPMELDDCWQYDASGWTHIQPLTVPGARHYHAMTYDGLRGCVVLSGGRYYGDLWQLAVVPASCTPYGAGCLGSAGTPLLAAAGGALPALGAAFALELTALPATPGLCLFAFGIELVHWNGAPLPLSLAPLGLPGCQLHVAPSPGASTVLAHLNSVARLAFAIPNNPALAGWSVGAQALVFDAAAAGGIGSVSNGVVLVLH
jgi:hypothetical protein